MNIQQKLRMLALLNEMQSILLDGEDDSTTTIASLQAADIVSHPQAGDEPPANHAPHDTPQNRPNRYQEAAKNWLMKE